MLTYTLLMLSNKTGQLCAVDQLYGIQNNTGTVSASNILSFVTQVITGGLPIIGSQQSFTCNNCTKEVYNIVISNVPQVITSSANSSISNQCGASFIGSPTFYLSLVSIVDGPSNRWQNTRRNITDRSRQEPACYKEQQWSTSIIRTVGWINNSVWFGYLPDGPFVTVGHCL